MLIYDVINKRGRVECAILKSSTEIYLPYSLLKSNKVREVWSEYRITKVEIYDLPADADLYDIPHRQSIRELTLTSAKNVRRAVMSLGTTNLERLVCGDPTLEATVLERLRDPRVQV